MSRRLICRTAKLDKPAQLSALIPSVGYVWLAPGTSLVGLGQLHAIDPGSGPLRFEEAASRLEELFGEAEIEDPVDLPGTGPVAFGSFTFDPAQAGSELVVPARVLGFTEGVAWETTITDPAGQSGPVPFDPSRKTHEIDDPPPDGQSSTSSQFWTESVRSVRQAIAKGEVEKVVLARKLRLTFPRSIDRRLVMQRLAAGYPECFTFGFGHLLGASPELLVRRLGDVVDSMPLAGSARRGGDEAEDQRIGTELQGSAKDLAEHKLTVASVVDKLAPLCSELSHEKLPSLLLLANVQHLSTKVQGILKRPVNAVRLAGALHPTAAVCGVPEAAALQTIRALENFERRRYAGPVGWIDHRGDGEWAVALRCAEIDRNVANVYAGAGILEGSDPMEEWQETNLKMQAVLTALGSING